mmetsp:Transcript_29164/g.53790  ORF Transcript_29164/g.53790 Transcript_29164/m.53790 type:complete len:344 (-) Transcript_29164:269-1300(-)
MATSLDALEALLQFREGIPKKKLSPDRSLSIHPAMPVPNPLDPAQPHIIEGDTPTRTVNRPAFGSGAKSAFSPKSAMAPAPVVTTVPNPLATPIAEKYPVQHPLPASISFAKALSPSSTLSQISTHGFEMHPLTPMTTKSSDAKSMEVELQTDKIQDALNSRPQRGKKRRNLSDLERSELTRTRNREHAKSTRMKKKARIQELIETEKEYLLLKEKETLDQCRINRLVQYVENVGSTSEQHEIKDCLHSSRLKRLASQEILKPEFAVIDTVALTTENSGMVKVSAHGTDLESGNPKTLSGVICVDYTPETADISAIFLYWSSPQSSPSSVGIVPSVSVLSFEF